jgi:hypothetical protein
MKENTYLFPDFLQLDRRNLSSRPRPYPDLVELVIMQTQYRLDKIPFLRPGNYPEAAV